jgi:hypothetical protein
MTIVVKQTSFGYEAIATPPHVSGAAWQSSHPMPVGELIAALLQRGCHQTDIGDAFYAANPNWLADVSSPDPSRVQP